MKKSDSPKLTVDIGIAAKQQLAEIAYKNRETMTDTIKRMIAQEAKK